MKTTKKFLSILLATILILSLFPVSLAHASDNTITFSAQTDVVSAKAGDIVNVDICMSENSVVAALTLIVNYDNTALKILNVQSKEAFGYEEFNTAYGNSKLAYLTASATPKTIGGTLFTIQFEVLKDGCTEISLSVDELTDIDLNPLSSATESAKIHKFDNGTVTQPTCTDQGYTTYTCACGYSYQTDETDAKGHNFVNGTCTECSEKSVKWKFDEETGTLTIYGTGPMEDCYDGGRPWESFKDDIQTVVIEYGVTSIGRHAFSNCTSLESVIIPDSVTTIDDYAFEFCYSLVSTKIGNGVTRIGNSAFALCLNLSSIKIPDTAMIISDYAFQGCEGLESVTIGDSVTIIGKRAFEECTSLTGITIPDSVTTIDDYAFCSCISLTNVIIGDGVITIGERTFSSCNLKSVTIGNSVTEIGDYAFASCDSLVSVILPNSVTRIGDRAFSSCDNLVSITIPDNVTVIGEGAFYDCYNLKNVKIPNNVEKISDETFLGCYSLTSVTIPNNVTTIGENAFGYCTSLIDVVIPDSVTKIGSFAFFSCDSLTRVTIGDSVTSIGVRAFAYCTSLTDVYYLSTEEEWNDISIDRGNDPLLNARIHYNSTGADTHPFNPVVTPPTCTEQGFTTYTCECGDTYIDDYVNANGHSYSSVVTAPTCTETGFTTYTCTACGDTYVDDETPATGHNYSSEITKPATHTENGEMTFTCACGDTYTETINATGDHFYTPAVTSPTCTEGGYTTYTCVCGDTYIDDETQAKGHSFSNGNCTVCGETDPDYYVFSVKAPSRTKIRNKDGIVLHTEIAGNQPDGSYVEWTSNNNNFSKTVMNDGESLQVIANNKGNTTFTATLYDANGNVLATDTIELYSQSGFFDKIGGFFRSLFGTTKIYEI